MSLKLNSSGGGSVTLQEPVTASTLTLTLPAFSGTAATLASVTNNGVLFVNSSGQPTSGSALTFDGTALAPDGTTRTLGTTALRWGTVYATAFADGTDQLVGSSGAQARFGYGASWTSQAFAISGSEQMRLTSTGLGIGTSSPGVKLQVAGDVSAVNGRFRGNTTGTTILNNGTVSVDGGFGGLLIIGCGDGSSAHFYCPYSTATSLIRSDTVATSFSASDSGTALRIYKSSNSTTVTIKNSTGGTVAAYVTVYTGF